MREIEVGGDDDDEECKHGQQIDLPGIVTVVADFPAHCLFPPEGASNQCRDAAAVPRVGQRCCKLAWSMIRYRFSEKIMLKQRRRTG